MLVPTSLLAQVFINEIHYDNAGTDQGEAIEIAGPAGTDLSDWQLVLYNGSNGTVYNTTSLTGVLADQTDGFGFQTVAYPANGIQNGAPDGIALIGPAGEVVQFISYEGVVSATEGAASGSSSVDIEVSETSSTPVGFSLQQQGTGNQAADFTWGAPAENTFGTVNPGQSFGEGGSEPPTVVLIINEILADPLNAPEGDANGDGTSSATQDEFVELYNNTDSDLDVSDWTLADGNGVRHTFPAATVIPAAGTIVVFGGGEPNGSFGGSLVQTASSGALGLNNSGDVITIARDATAIATLSYGGEGGDDQSLTRSPDISGESFVAHSTVSSAIFSPGTLADGSQFAGNDEVITPVTPVSIAAARNLPDGTVVQVEGVLTVSDQLGGPAYLQDASGGIAVFDADIHGDGNYAVGDQLRFTATRTSFNDQIQLGEVDPATIERVSPTTIVITPRVITLDELSTAFGELVALTEVAFPAPGDLLWPNSNFTLTDASGSGELRIDADVVDLVAKAQPARCEVTGVVGSFRGTPQLLPRQAADLPCATDFVPVSDTSTVSPEQTLDVVTWNIEWFGNTSNGPSPETGQRDSVRAIIEALDADVYAFQEISSETLLTEVADALPDYELVIQTDFVSQPPNEPGVSQKLAFLYKSAVVTPVRTEGLLADIHPLYNGGDASALVGYPVEDRTRFYASGRLPYLLEADVTIGGVTERIHFIDLHARANSSRDPQERYDMRRYDVEALKNYIDTALTDAQVILLGDYNDDVDETVADVDATTSSYVAYVADSTVDATDDQFYRVVTASLSEAGFRSFVSRENMIDHIAVTDELVDNVLAGTETVHYEFFDGDYASTTSDHFPVSARLRLATSDESQVCTAAGYLERATWRNLWSSKLSRIPTDRAPDTHELLTQFEAPQNQGRRYGSRLRGILCPPQTGDYTFWIASDDRSALYLSTDTSASNKQKIASVPGYTAPRQWNRYPSQRSATVRLEQGKSYYIEALHREFYGGDHVAVAWSYEGQTQPTIIPGAVLSPVEEAYRPADQPTAVEAGVNYRYYEGFWGKLPKFARLRARATGHQSTVTLGKQTRPDGFAFQWESFIEVPKDGIYTFFTQSDDGSALYIGDQRVVDNDGLHPAQEASGSIALRAGKHALRVEYFEFFGGETLQVLWEHQGVKEAIPADRLFRTSEPIAARTATSPDKTTSELLKTTAELSVYPVPVQDNFSLRVLATQAEQLRVQIVDTQGRTVYDRSAAVKAGEQVIDLNVAELRMTPGVYLVRTQSRSQSYAPLRFVVE